MSLSQDRQKKDLSDEVALDENTAEPAATEVAETDNAAEVITGMETEALEEESGETAKEDDAGNDEASSDTAEEHEVDFIQSSGLSKDGQMLYLVRRKVIPRIQSSLTHTPDCLGALEGILQGV